MKSAILTFGFIVIASVFITGCGQRSSNATVENTNSELTASDLSRLLDYHAWRLRIPEAQQPIKSIQLVIMKRPDIVIDKYIIANDLSHESCSSILLGFRVEQGALIGQLFTQDAKGGGLGWSINFTNSFARSHPGWAVPGTLKLDAIEGGGRIMLGMATTNHGAHTLLYLSR